MAPQPDMKTEPFLRTGPSRQFVKAFVMRTT